MCIRELTSVKFFECNHLLETHADRTQFNINAISGTVNLYCLRGVDSQCGQDVVITGHIIGLWITPIITQLFSQQFI